MQEEKIKSFFKFQVGKEEKEINPDKLFSKILPEGKLHDAQYQIFDGIENYMFTVWIASRQIGKSYTSMILALTKIIQGNKRVTIVAPTYKLSTIIWDYFLPVVKQLGLETTKVNQKDKTIMFSNGSEFSLGTAERPDSLVGRFNDLIVVDEAAIITDSDYLSKLLPTLTTREGARAVFISTPRGKTNYMYDFYNRGQDPEEHDWISFLHTSDDNPIKNEKIMAANKKVFSEAQYQQEYYCSWVDIEGSIYPSLDEEKHLIDTSKIDMEGYIGGLDFGYSDPNAYCTIGYKEVDGLFYYYIVDEFMEKELTNRQLAEMLQEKNPGNNIETVYGDNSDPTTINTLVDEFDLPVEPCIKTKSIKDGVNFIHGLIDNGRLFFDKEKGIETFKMMKDYVWDERTTHHANPKPIHKYSHRPDALRYGIFSHHESYITGGIFDETDAKRFWESKKESEQKMLPT